MTLGADAANLVAATTRAGKKYGLGNWFVNQIRAESNFNPNARSPAGAVGIAQFMPATARGVGLADPFNPIAALDASAKLMAGYVRQYGDVSKALAAYNAGPGNVSRWQSIPETRAYVAKILQGKTPAATATPSAPATPAVSATPGFTIPGVRQRSLPGVPTLDEGPLSQSVLRSFVSGGGRIDMNSLAALTGESWKTPAPIRMPSTPAMEFPGMPGAPGRTGQGQQTPGVKGKVFTSPGADRAGAPTKQAVRDFVAQVAGVYGKPLTIENRDEPQPVRRRHPPAVAALDGRRRRHPGVGCGADEAGPGRLDRRRDEPRPGSEADRRGVQHQRQADPLQHDDGREPLQPFARRDLGGTMAAKKKRGNAKVHTVMSEFKRGTLRSGSKKGPKVTSRDQAVAIAMSEAGKAKKKAKKR